MASTAAGEAITKPVIRLMKDVIKEEDNRQILHTDLRSMESLLQYTDIFFSCQQKEPFPSLGTTNGLFHSLPEANCCKIWLQLLQNSLTEANGLFHRSGRRQSCLDGVVCNPGRLSKEIREWKAFFDHLYQGFSNDLFLHISSDAIISQVIDLVIELLKDVSKEEPNRPILRTDLRRMESLLGDITLFRDEPNITTLFQPLKLLQKSLSEAKGLHDRCAPRQSFLDRVVCDSWRLSKERREWSASFDKIYHSFQSDLSILVTSPQFLSPKALHKDEALVQGVAAPGFGGSGIIDAQAQVERWLNEGDRVHVIGVYGLPGVGKTSLLRMLYNKVNHVFEKLIWVSVSEYYKMFDLQSAIQLQCEVNLNLPDSLDERKMKLSAYLKKKNFLLVLDGLWSRLDLQELGVAFGDHKHSKVLFSTRRKDLIPEMSADESTEIQPLSKEEGWMLFRRLAFKDDQVSVDIQDRGRKIADECRGVYLAIYVVAAAMIGQTSLHEWDICLSSIQNVDPSFPATAPGLDSELYAALRFSYDALPNSDVKKCFLYCALYNEKQEIDTPELVQMWIAEGVVKSKQGTYLMDMAVGRKYLKLLVDRCLFQRSYERTNVFKKNKIRVQSAIRDMAIYIGQKEENCLFMATQNQPNFPEVYDENCRIISLANLPTHLQCPKLASLTLRDNRTLKELPSEFVRSLTSLRVLNLSGCTQMASVPTSIEKLRMLEFLSLRHLPIQDLPKEVCRLSKLQFLDLSNCESLKSLPSEIGEIKNLKCLNLDRCGSLKMIPREISELTSLSRLVLPWEMGLSMETEAPASIWSLKGLKNMTELRVSIREGQQLKDGIMGSWSEMRHLMLIYFGDEDLPEDMKSMKKLQSFMLDGYWGYHCLPNCKFEHLEVVSLSYCRNISDLSPLEWMPNLKLLKLRSFFGLRELGIGSRGSGSPSGYQRLQKLVLNWLYNLESLGGASKRGVWDERTLPHLRVLKIRWCDSLKRFPVGMEKLPNLRAIRGSAAWWSSITWEDDDMKIKLQNIFKPY